MLRPNSFKNLLEGVLMKTSVLQVTLFLAAALLGTVASAASLDNIQFIKVAAQDSRAVIKGADGKLRVIKPGDAISEGVIVKEIAPGRILLEEKTDSGPETVIVRIANDKTTIERRRKLPEHIPLLVAPGKSGN
jgi:hypothetical protein